VKVTIVRHATLLLETSVGRVLVDPMLRPAGTSPPVENTPNPRRNPLVELPFPAEEVIADVDLCVVTHLHGDHFDETAAQLLPKDLPILTQPESADALRHEGFTNVSTSHPAFAMTRGQHGKGEIGAAMGPVSGWVVDGVYITGDTILCDEVYNAIEEHDPRVVIVNGGGARFHDGDPITMTAIEVRELHAVDLLPIVVVHLEAINHCLEHRDAYTDAIVPLDGERLDL
jgi:L-ascorbate metabolism protein UlaG (beta-lactamase superfamily)